MILFNFFNYSRKKKVFKEVKFGDVVYCRMPLTKKELKNVPKGHENRPYLVVGKTKKELIAFYGTHKKIDNWKSYYLKPSEYPEFKFYGEEVSTKIGTYFDLSKIYYISIDRIYTKTIELNDFCLGNLNRTLNKLYNSQIIDSNWRKEDIEYKEGDIFINQEENGRENRWILSGDNICYPMTRLKTMHSLRICIPEDIKLNEEYIDINYTRSLKDLNPKGLIWSVSDCEKSRIKKALKVAKREAKQSKNKKKAILPTFYRYPIGSVFEEKYSGDHCIYLYSTRKSDYGFCLEDFNYFGHSPVRALSMEDLIDTNSLYSPNSLLEAADKLNDSQSGILIGRVVNTLLSQMNAGNSKIDCQNNYKNNYCN